MSVGIWSKVSKQFVFGIKAETAKEAYKKLREKIGYYESCRERWVCKPIPKQVVKGGINEREE